MNRLSNARHGVGDGHGGQTSAIIERITSNARHGIANGDGSQTATICRTHVQGLKRPSATCFSSFQG